MLWLRGHQRPGKRTDDNDNFLDGGDDADMLQGGGVDDTLIGGPGEDQVHGYFVGTLDSDDTGYDTVSYETFETVEDGLGIVVQAYSKCAPQVIDWLYDMARRLDRQITIRLVKGAYWDTEIKRAQVEGIEGFPVFTSKAATDVSYIANARKLLSMTDRIYPQ